MLLTPKATLYLFVLLNSASMKCIYTFKRRKCKCFLVEISFKHKNVFTYIQIIFASKTSLFSFSLMSWEKYSEFLNICSISFLEKKCMSTLIKPIFRYDLSAQVPNSKVWTFKTYNFFCVKSCSCSWHYLSVDFKIAGSVAIIIVDIIVVWL